MVREIEAAELAEWRRTGQPHTLLDVREDWEWALCHIDGAHHIPLSTLPARFGELPGDVPVIAVCHHGMRSWNAAQWLEAQGIEAVNLTGGIDAWARTIDRSLAVY